MAEADKANGQRQAQDGRAGRLSLRPLQFEDALDALLKTPPAPKDGKRTKTATARPARQRTKR
jgi:hypothetical protein